MDVREDIESYLNALKKLYRLLIINHGRQSLQNHASQDNILDEKARFLLKDLLDGASERVLKSASEVIASILGLSNTHSLTEQQHSQNSLKLELHMSNAQDTSLDVKRTDKDLHGQATDLSINKQVPDNDTVQSVALEQSEASIYAAELRNRKKRCRICRRSSAKQMKFEKGKSSAEEPEDINKEITSLQRKLCHQVDAQEKVLESNTKAVSADLSNDREMQQRILGFQFNPTGNGAAAHSPNRYASRIVTSGALQNFATGTEKKHEDIDCISRDASDVIKTIKTRISALKVGGKQVSSCGKQTEPHQGGLFKFAAASVSGTGMSSPNMEKKAGLVSQGDQTQFGHFVLGRNDSHSLVIRRRARETKGLTRWRQLSRYVLNPLNELNLPNQSVRNSTSLSPWNAQPSKSLCQNVGKDNEINLGGNALSRVEKLIEGQKLGLHNVSPVHVQNVKNSVGKVDLMSQNKNSPSRTNSVLGLRIPPNLDKKDKKNSLLEKLPRKTNKSILDGNRVAQKNKISKVGKIKPSVPAVSGGNKQIQTQCKTAATSKGVPHRKTIRQTLPDPFMYEDQMEKDRGKVKKKINQKGQQRMSLSDQQESNGSPSSSWTTQQGSTSSYDSQEYSVTNNSQSSQHSATSENEGDYVSGSTHGHHSGSTSYSERELSSAPSSTQSLENSNSSSENVSYLPSDQTTSSLSSSDPSYRQGRYSRRYRSYRKRPKKRTGRLKKLKDKVAIIFHHHHHHHYDDDDSNHSEDQSQAYHDKPLPKHAAKMFNERNQAETYGEKAAEKLSKSMVRNVPNKKQGANLNKLVGGLVRHVRQSKKSKKSKGGIEHQAKNQHVNKKLAKKVHWWQLLRRRRMKMPKKPRIKLESALKSPSCKQCQL